MRLPKRIERVLSEPWGWRLVATCCGRASIRDRDGCCPIERALDLPARSIGKGADPYGAAVAGLHAKQETVEAIICAADGPSCAMTYAYDTGLRDRMIQLAGIPHVAAAGGAP